MYWSAEMRNLPEDLEMNWLCVCEIIVCSICAERCAKVQISHSGCFNPD